MASFIDISLLEEADFYKIIQRAISLKKQLKEEGVNNLLKGKQLAMIFEKPSTRTRISFEVGINQLGGNAIFIDVNSSQLSRGESIEDTAKVLSGYVDMIMIRCFEHKTLSDLDKFSSIPVINGLTDKSHPCQVAADIMTFIEYKKTIKNKIIAWIGDGNNMAASWIQAAKLLDFTLNIATPEKFKPDDKLINRANTDKIHVNWFNNPIDAAKNADAVTTDTWVSMGDKDVAIRKKLLAEFQVNSKLMGYAKKDAIFMHCLPAHREEEVTAEVIDGPQSVIFEECENRLHIQKAIMLWCMGL